MEKVIIEVLDKLYYLDRRIILTIRYTCLGDLKINLNDFLDYSKADNDPLAELTNIDKTTPINTISFWYNEMYNTYTIEIITDNQTFKGNFFKADLLDFLKSIREDQVLASTVDISKIF